MILLHGKAVKMDKPPYSEIVKDLKCLEKDTNCGDCAVIKQCKGDCVFRRLLNLINCLQADCDNYKQVAENQQKITLDRGFEIKELKAEIERLKEEKARVHKVIPKIIKTAKAEAYKECIEKVKKELSLLRRKCRNDLDNDGVFAIDRARKRVNNLLKELVGEDNVAKD